MGADGADAGGAGLRVSDVGAAFVAVEVATRGGSDCVEVGAGGIVCQVFEDHELK